MSRMLTFRTDKSNGYEDHAATFIRCRSKGIDGVGASSVRLWASSLLPNATVLDVGCGAGDPISKALVEAGFHRLWGLMHHLRWFKIFKQNFPDSPVACEAAEDSSFFNRQFDAIISWGTKFSF
jgi:2-polyprenyl-3-methyl-5-hydroxy-6-metoxy-1,4-benzoquinol methylase